MSPLNCTFASKKKQSRMKKQTVRIEHDLRSKSANVIWQLLSSAEGLEKWIADSVTREDNNLTLTWGEVWKVSETWTATIVEEEKLKRIRWKWVDDEDEDAFVELALDKSDITNDYTLLITDHAYDEDVEDLKDIWARNLKRLHRTTGL